MVLPLFPVVASAAGSTLAAASGWMFLKYESMSQQIEMINAHTQQLQLSADSLQKNSIWRELLEPLANRWSGAVKLLAYSVAAASTAVIVIGCGTWHELRAGREEASELESLRRENRLLRQMLEDECPGKLRALDRAKTERLITH